MASTYTPIATQTLGSAASTVSFSSIPSTYTDLIMIINYKNTNNSDAFQMRLNSDTGTNYSFTQMGGNGSSVFSSAAANADSMRAAGISTGPTNANNQPIILHFMNYANTNVYKTVLNRYSDAAGDLAMLVGLWRSTSAINAVSFFNLVGSTIAAGSTFTLYGVTNA